MSRALAQSGPAFLEDVEGRKPLVHNKLLNMAIDSVDFPVKIVIFHSYVKLPEGKA